MGESKPTLDSRKIPASQKLTCNGHHRSAQKGNYDAYRSRLDVSALALWDSVFRSVAPTSSFELLKGSIYSKLLRRPGSRLSGAHLSAFRTCPRNWIRSSDYRSKIKRGRIL